MKERLLTKRWSWFLFGATAILASLVPVADSWWEKGVLILVCVLLAIHLVWAYDTRRRRRVDR
jgi:membrane protein implicated in regulation of membrane protease activity